MKHADSEVKYMTFALQIHSKHFVYRMHNEQTERFSNVLFTKATLIPCSQRKQTEETGPYLTTVQYSQTALSSDSGEDPKPKIAEVTYHCD
jgi:hypothetical protein